MLMTKLLFVVLREKLYGKVQSDRKTYIFVKKKVIHELHQIRYKTFEQVVKGKEREDDLLHNGDIKKEQS